MFMNADVATRKACVMKWADGQTDPCRFINTTFFNAAKNCNLHYAGRNTHFLEPTSSDPTSVASAIHDTLMGPISLVLH